MINLDFSFAIALYVFISSNIVLIVWIFSKRGKDKELTLNPGFLWFCSVCTYTYINTKEETISICPRCASYNKKELTKTLA